MVGFLPQEPEPQPESKKEDSSRKVGGWLKRLIGSLCCAFPKCALMEPRIPFSKFSGLIISIWILTGLENELNRLECVFVCVQWVCVCGCVCAVSSPPGSKVRAGEKGRGFQTGGCPES